jgi:hypothetical protein
MRLAIKKKGSPGIYYGNSIHYMSLTGERRDVASQQLAVFE